MDPFLRAASRDAGKGQTASVDWSPPPMADRPPSLEYRRSLPQGIRKVEQGEATLFYVPPFRLWQDSVFWICFLLGSTLSTWVFSEPLIEALNSDPSRVPVLVLLLIFSWGICGWLSVKASVGMNPHWRLSVSASRLSFHSRAAWKAMDGTWDRAQIAELVVEDADGQGAQCEFGLRLQDGTKVGLVFVDKAHSQETLEMAADVSQRLDVPVQVRLPLPHATP
jgi:hypothetical protein